MKVKDIISIPNEPDVRLLWLEDIGNHEVEDVWNNWEGRGECPSYLLDMNVSYLNAEKDETLTIGMTFA